MSQRGHLEIEMWPSVSQEKYRDRQHKMTPRQDKQVPTGTESVRQVQEP